MKDWSTDSFSILISCACLEQDFITINSNAAGRSRINSDSFGGDDNDE